MKSYKAVPGPKAFTVSEGNTNEAFSSFAKIINAECVDGWEYHSMQNIQITETHPKTGCFLKPTVVPPTTTNYYMLIFVKEEK